jgi:hypothetical protein
MGHTKKWKVFCKTNWEKRLQRADAQKNRKTKPSTGV